MQHRREPEQRIKATSGPVVPLHRFKNFGTVHIRIGNNGTIYHPLRELFQFRRGHWKYAASTPSLDGRFTWKVT